LRLDGRLLEDSESFAYAAGERDDPLALVAVERLLPGCDGLVSAAGGLEHFAEMVERVALEEGRVAPLGPGDGFAGEALCLGMLPARRVDERLRLPPGDLRHHIVGRGELASLLGERLSLVVTAERAEEAPQARRILGEVAYLAARLHRVALR